MVKILNISIANAWTSKDFASFFGDIRVAYKLAQIHSHEDFLYRSFADELFFFSRSGVRGRSRLPLFYPSELDVAVDFLIDSFKPLTDMDVIGIDFHSPGNIDLLGVGKIVEQLRIFITDIVDRTLAAPDRELARRVKEEELRARKIENATRLLDLEERLRGPGDPMREILERLIRVDDAIERKAQQGQITGAKMKDVEKPVD